MFDKLKNDLENLEKEKSGKNKEIDVLDFRIIKFIMGDKEFVRRLKDCDNNIIDLKRYTE